MAGYAKHNFEDGQVLHAQALNEMDDAIGEVKSDIFELVKGLNTVRTTHSITINGNSTKAESCTPPTVEEGYIPNAVNVYISSNNSAVTYLGITKGGFVRFGNVSTTAHTIDYIVDWNIVPISN